MDNVEIEKAFDSFITDKDCKIVVLKGKWGAGKTRAWNDYIKANKGKNILTNYSYVSLFGIETQKELRSKIGLEQVDKSGKRKANQWIVNHEKKIFSILRFLPKGSSLQEDFIDTWVTSEIEDTLICVDDFERLSQGLDVQTIMGFFSHLKEEKNCKLLLIMNDDYISSISANDNYKKFKEKVIDYEIDYSPSLSNQIKKIIPHDQFNRDELIMNFKLFEIENMRLMKRVISFSNAIRDANIKKIDPRLLSRITRMLTLFVYCTFVVEEGLPETNKILNLDEYLKYIVEKTPEGKWLEEKGFYEFEEIDLILGRFVVSGLFEVGNFNHQIEILAQNKRVDSIFYEAWQIYHGSFNEDLDELVSMFESEFKNFPHEINFSQSNSVFSVLRDLEQNDLADELVNIYFDRISDDKDKILNYRDIEIGDALLKVKILEQYAYYVEQITLEDAVNKRFDGDFSVWYREVIEKATEIELKNLFELIEGPDFIKKIRMLLSDCGQDVKVRIIKILTDISKESQINSVRISNMLKLN